MLSEDVQASGKDKQLRGWVGQTDSPFPLSVRSEWWEGGRIGINY